MLKKSGVGRDNSAVFSQLLNMSGLGSRNDVGNDRLAFVTDRHIKSLML